MKRLLQWSIAGLLVVMALAACGGPQYIDTLAIPTTRPARPANGPPPSTLPTSRPAVVPTKVAPTRVPVAAAAPHVAAVAAPAPAASGPEAEGKRLFSSLGCKGCHAIQPSKAKSAGPNLANIGNEASDRVAGQVAKEYLHAAIVEPNAFVPQGYGKGAMPPTYAKTLTPAQVDALVAYLLALKQ